jgi:hypothetical protein
MFITISGARMKSDIDFLRNSNSLARSTGCRWLQTIGWAAVIASNTWSAKQGRQHLKIEWDYGPNAGHDSTRSAHSTKETIY